MGMEIFVEVLWKFYESFMKILLKLYGNLVEALWRFCWGAFHFGR
jgi:hypothetical protein